LEAAIITISVSGHSTVVNNFAKWHGKFCKIRPAQPTQAGGIGSQVGIVPYPINKIQQVGSVARNKTRI